MKQAMKDIGSLLFFWSTIIFYFVVHIYTAVKLFHAVKLATFFVILLIPVFGDLIGIATLFRIKLFLPIFAYAIEAILYITSKFVESKMRKAV